MTDKPQGQTAPALQKYKYLSSTSNQFSPNLRKEYEEQYQKYSATPNDDYDRVASLNKYDKYRKAGEKSPSCNTFNPRKIDTPPSCNTFNPRRQTTQGQFSPYEQKEDKSPMIKELLQTNNLLKQQVRQVSLLCDKLRLQLTSKDTQLHKIRERLQCTEAKLRTTETELNGNLHQFKQDTNYYTELIAQMKEEIGIVLTKNKILQQENIQARVMRQELVKQFQRQLKQRQIRQRQIMRQRQIRDIKERQLREIRQINEIRQRKYSRDKDMGRMSIPFDASKLDGKQQSCKIQRQEVRHQPVSPRNVRTVGKLLNKSLHASRPDSLNVSRQQHQQHHQIRIQEQPQPATTTSIPASAPLKTEQLIASIRLMYAKITNQQDAPSLKQVWKWLKHLGYVYSGVKKWRRKIENKIAVWPPQRLRQILQEISAIADQ